MKSTVNPDALGECWSRLRDQRPRVHCITNTVVQGFTANVLLAAGAVPSMTTDPEEIRSFVERSDALLVNLGTLDADRRTAIAVAVESVASRGRRFVLDPVFIDVAAPRLAFAKTLLAGRPGIVRGNAAELAALVGAQPTPASAAANSTVLALSAPVDCVLAPDHEIFIANGHPYAALVTGAGCALSALMAALLAVEPDAALAAATGFAAFGIAQERAAEVSRGPGTFATHLLDALHAVSPADLTGKAKLS